MPRATKRPRKRSALIWGEPTYSWHVAMFFEHRALSTHLMNAIVDYALLMRRECMLASSISEV